MCWVFLSVQGLSLVAASGGHSSSRCAGLSLSQPLMLRSTDSRCAGSVIVAHGPSCSVACGIFPDQGSNPCPLHWQADFSTTAPAGKPKHPVLNRGLDFYCLSCREPKPCHVQHFIFFPLESGPGSFVDQWTWRGGWLGQDDVAEWRPRSLLGLVLPPILQTCRSR